MKTLTVLAHVFCFAIGMAACTTAPEMANAGETEVNPAVTAAVQAAPTTLIPAAYRKVWAVNGADCATEPGLTRIAIAPAAVKFSDGRYDVLSLEENGSRELLMQVNRVVEGLATKEVHVLKIIEPGGRLSYQRGGQTLVYRSCPQV